jgi:hypothetical protein
MSSHSASTFPFDPDGASPPDGVPLPPEDGGEVVLLLADESARESGWGPRAAVALARRWADRGRRIFLMDGDPVEPALHVLLKVENREGVTDAVRFGVSPSRMALPQGDNLLFAPAGSVAADPADVFRHPRWASVLGACREAGSVVLLYLPEGVPGVDELAGEGDRVVRLRGEAPQAQAAEPGVVTLHPGEPGEPVAPEAGPPPVEPADAGSMTGPSIGTAVGAPKGEPVAAVQAGSGEDAPAAKAGWADATGPKGSKGPKAQDDFGPRVVGRRTSAWIILIVLLLVGGVVAAAWLGLLDVPGITQPPAAAAPEGATGLRAGLSNPAR